MPIKTSETKFQLTPYGITRAITLASIVAFIALILGLCGLLVREYPGYWVIYPIIGVVIIGDIVYLVMRIIKTKSGSLEYITVDVEGIKLHSEKLGLIKHLSWEDDPSSTINYEDVVDNEGNVGATYPSNIIVSTNKESIDINLGEYVSFLLKAEKLTEHFKKAMKDFRKKYRELAK